MTVDEFVDSIPNFLQLAFVEQIKRFCWFLSFHGKRISFSGTDIANCFDGTNISKPSGISPFLSHLAKQKPPFLLRKNGGYGLSRHAHEQFDSSLGQRAATVAVAKALTELPSRLSIDVEKTFLDEAITCFRHKAYRAAIVMTWNLAYDHLCQVIIKTKLQEFNAALATAFPRAGRITKREDFEDLKESHVLQVARSADVITGNVKKVFEEKLTRRNMAAHPSSIVTLQETAEEFIRDLIENAVLKLGLP